MQYFRINEIDDCKEEECCLFAYCKTSGRHSQANTSLDLGKKINPTPPPLGKFQRSKIEQYLQNKSVGFM